MYEMLNKLRIFRKMALFLVFISPFVTFFTNWKKHPKTQDIVFLVKNGHKMWCFGM